MFKALDTIKVAQELDNDDGDMHRWYGIILSGIGAHVSTKEYISNSFAIRSHWEQAIALNPSDASAHHLVGRWCFDVASMPWWKRKVASTVFAEPPSSSYREALDFFNLAERISPGFWKKNLLMVAKCHLAMNNKADAELPLEQALAIVSRTDEDKVAHEETQALLKQHFGR